MLTAKGHLFHIDFGKFLGDSQMFGSFKRDRAPFVLTSDMLFVINEGEKVSQRFHRFVELCCQAFRIVRQNGGVLMNLFAMMATAGIPGVDIKSVAYIQNALLPECSNVEAAARFTRFIEDSSKFVNHKQILKKDHITIFVKIYLFLLYRNWFTSVNFFIHSLAQLRFASDSTDNPATLSFMPKMYSIDTEGRIEFVSIVDFQKKYDPEKYYSYTVKVSQ
jgi:phosphatidylinositol-4-phosphate 3-kinase